MVIIIFFIVHWYVSLFSQTFLMHRYASHGAFQMSKFWERFFYIFAWLTMGSSYLSTRAYATMHRMHHAFADTPKDPHSPLYFPNVFAMMWQTAKTYTAIYEGRVPIEERFLKNVPDWPAFDRFASSMYTRVAWVAVYLAFYIRFATHWWLFLLLPFTILIGPVHGAVINWYAHKFGYKGYKVSNTSTNLLPIDIIMLGESYHNNHHKFASSINFGVRWFEIDPVYYAILFLSFLGIVKLKPTSKDKIVTEF